jgi:signal transduction histidine kinase
METKIVRRRMIESTRERIPRLLREFAASLAGSAPNEEHLLDAAVHSCRELLQANQCSVWLIDPPGRKLVLQAAEGYLNLTPDKIGVLFYPLERHDNTPLGITAWIHVHQKPVSADSYRELQTKPGYRGEFDPELHDVNRAHVSAAEHPCQQFYGGPIYLGNERFGVLKVENKIIADADGERRFSDADKDALDTVAAMIAMALKHARASMSHHEQLLNYHSFTVHSIRNVLTPVEAAADILSQHPEHIAQALRLLRIGTRGLNFYIANLLKFLQAHINPTVMQPLPIVELLSNEKWLLGEEAGDTLDCHIDANGCQDARVRADSEFLSAALKELLRNARKAVFRRRELERLQGRKSQKGHVEIGVNEHEPTDELQEPHICVVVRDDGDATVDEEARDALMRAWSKAKKGSFRSESSGPFSFGLAFISWVIRAHGGYVTADVAEGRTSLIIHLPLTSKGGA